MPRRYSPVKITNPTSSLHVVKLHPHQSFVVTLQNTSVEETQISITSSFFRLETAYNLSGNAVYVFRQDFNLRGWVGISKLYLGEVIVIYKNLISCLCVVLESRSKNLTIINPIGQEVRVGIDTGVRIIIRSHERHEHLITCDSNWNFEQIDYDYVTQSAPVFISGHHYWFKLHGLSALDSITYEKGEHQAAHVDFGEWDVFFRISLKPHKEQPKIFPLKYSKGVVIKKNKSYNSFKEVKLVKKRALTFKELCTNDEFWRTQEAFSIHEQTQRRLVCK